MAKEIRTKLDAWTSFTITLGGLLNNAGRQSTILANTLLRPASLVFMRIRSGAVAPTANAIYEFYLLRGNSAGNRTDGAGASDAAITILNAQMLGTLAVTASANTDFQDEFDTAPLGKLGTEWGIAVKNVSGQTINAANHVAQYALYVPEIQ